MSKNFDYSLKDISSNLEKSLKEAELLGEGHNGVVFLLENNKAIKIVRKNQKCGYLSTFDRLTF